MSKTFHTKTKWEPDYVKYIDDSSKVASVNLMKSLVQDHTNRPCPLNYHERTCMVLDPAKNVLQQELDRFQVECDQGNFVTNRKKTVILLFNASRKYSFPPEFSLGQDNLTVKKVKKIL